MHAPAPICAMPLLDPAGVLAEINRTWQSAAPDEIAELLEPYFTEDVVGRRTEPCARRARARGGGGELRRFRPQRKSTGANDRGAADRFRRRRCRCDDGLENALRIRWAAKPRAGTDTYVFRRDAGDWRICWRSLLSAADESPGGE